MKQNLTVFSSVGHIITICGIFITLMANLIAPAPPMAHWPISAVIGTTIALVLVAANSMLTLITYNN